MTQKEVYGLIEQHFRKNREKLVRVLIGPCNGVHNAEDALQNAYLEACERWNTFDPNKSSFNTWFALILVQRVGRTLREINSHGMTYRKDNEFSEVFDLVDLVYHPIEERLDDAIFLQEIDEIIAKKRPLTARILRAVLGEQKSYEEVAQEVGSNVSNVTSHVHNFRKELR